MTVVRINRVCDVYSGRDHIISPIQDDTTSVFVGILKSLNYPVYN